MTDPIDTTKRILAQATVDLLDDAPVPIWAVEVWGQPPFDYHRSYTLEAKTDSVAAQEGIRLFVEEMENLRDIDLKG
jgi:hypothetical protein